jgi:hypothetical protein
MFYALKIITRYLTTSKAQTAPLVAGVALGVNRVEIKLADLNAGDGGGARLCDLCLCCPRRIDRADGRAFEGAAGLSGLAALPCARQFSGWLPAA